MMNKDNIIRFDWASKYILRDKADFTILEGLVSAGLVLGAGSPPKGVRKESMSNVFPEYYVLRVCQYDESKEPVDAVDERMRYLKVAMKMKAAGIDPAPAPLQCGEGRNHHPSISKF